MSETHALAVDLAKVYATPARKTLVTTLAWGDTVEVVDVTDTHIEILTHGYEEQPDGSILPKARSGYIVPSSQAKGRDGKKLKPADVTRPRADNDVLKVNFVDVQQGDGAVIETPQGKVMLVDGGDNQMFARYLAARFRGTTAAAPLPVECILVTHGDADHFDGLSEIHKSEKHKNPLKRLFIAPKRVYHNGLVKRPAKDRADVELLGPTVEVGTTTLATGLVDDLLTVDDDQMNTPFRTWKKALTAWNKRTPGGIRLRRLAHGRDKDDQTFDFLAAENITAKVLGPFELTKSGNTGLPFLREPPKGPRIGHESLDTADFTKGGLSASHTINGHSVVLQLTYGAFTFLLTGDLNDQSSRTLARKHDEGTVDLRADVFKVPHHGSADFSGGFLERVAPVISVVSSGDESEQKEYIHPRATLMGALGRFSRVDEPLIFVTELVAFFKLEGWSVLDDPQNAEERARGSFFGFSRTAYGIVKTRTDGERLLVYTDSGKAELKEAYAYTKDADGNPVPAPVVSV